MIGGFSRGATRGFWETQSAYGGEFETAEWFESQSEYVTDGMDMDEILPNYIISFENLESDFECLTTLLGLSVKLPHKNPSISVAGEEGWKKQEFSYIIFIACFLFTACTLFRLAANR